MCPRNHPILAQAPEHMQVTSQRGTQHRDLVLEEVTSGVLSSPAQGCLSDKPDSSHLGGLVGSNGNRGHRSPSNGALLGPDFLISAVPLDVPSK